MTAAFLSGPGPRAFAHRGWHLGELAGCENTMAAFTAAVENGYRYLETDVRLTGDGVPVLMHDATLRRTTGRNAAVETVSWAELADARVNGREPVARLDALLGLLGDVPALRANIDVKSDAGVGPVVELLRERGVTGQVCLAAFSDRRLARLRSLLPPGTATSLGPREILLLGGTGGRLPPPRGAVAAQVPTRIRRRIPLLTPRYIAAAHRAGLEVHAWTIDEPDEMRRLLGLGVDGVITDRPDLLRDVLRERGQW